MKKIAILLGLVFTLSSYATTFDCKISTRVGDAKIDLIEKVESNLRVDYSPIKYEYFYALGEKTLLVYILERPNDGKNKFTLVSWLLDGNIQQIVELFRTYQWQEYDKRTIQEAFDDRVNEGNGVTLTTNSLSAIGNYSMFVECKNN